jgi:hypothetical protein
MKIDDKGREFFGSLETLDRMDQLNEAVDAYVDDLAPRVLNAIAATIRESTTKSTTSHWRYVEDRVSPTRFIGVTPRSSDLIRVEFGYAKKQQYGEFPLHPWVGIWAKKPLRFAAVITATQDVFHRPVTNEAEDGYPIFEYLSGWPDLWNGDWVDLHPICSDNGKRMSDVIAAQVMVMAIVEALESIPECLSPKTRTTSRQRARSSKVSKNNGRK